MGTHLSASRTYPVAVEDAFEPLLRHPLPALFARRYLAIPPIKAVVDDGTPWGSVGQQRTIELADGGRMRETLTSVQPGRSFGYRIDEISGPMQALVAQVDGLWTLAPVGTGTRVTWSWDISPTSPGRVAMPAFGRMWRGYARQALEHLESALVR